MPRSYFCSGYRRPWAIVAAHSIWNLLITIPLAMATNEPLTLTLAALVGTLALVGLGHKQLARLHPNLLALDRRIALVAREWKRHTTTAAIDGIDRHITRLRSRPKTPPPDAVPTPGR